MAKHHLAPQFIARLSTNGYFYLLDEADKYVVVRRIRAEFASEVVKTLESGWLRTFGPMVRLRAEAAPSHASEEFRQWYTPRGSLSTILPAEAH